MSVTLADVRSELNQIVDPNTGASLGAGIKDAQIQVKEGRVAVQVILGYPAASQIQAIGDLVRARLGAIGVADAAQEVERLGTPVAVGPDGDVRMTFHYSHTCAFDRDRLATVLTAVEGTITFESLWAPEVDDDQLETAASFSGE